jgi:hypothetical protein
MFLRRLKYRLLAKMRHWNAHRQLKKISRGVDFKAIHELNRTTLTKVPKWIDNSVRQDSIFQYGVPDEILHLLDKDIGSDITYTDIMLGLVGQFSKPIRYLEIGVSVGKNFLQVAHYLQNASIVGFDIEEINPVLKSKFSPNRRVEWPTQNNSIKKLPSSLTQFAQPNSHNQIWYLSGDVFDKNSWQKLSGKGQFNLIFSDALHTAEALMHELDMLFEYDLIDNDEFLMLWDDLGGPMHDAFIKIAQRLTKARNHSNNMHFVLPIKGWLGANWGDHPVGVFHSTRKK